MVHKPFADLFSFVGATHIELTVSQSAQTMAAPTPTGSHTA
jgi:hypothetical protein